MIDKSGGPAFPRAGHHENGNGKTEGMTLRDYFASSILAAMIANTKHQVNLGTPYHDNNLNFARAAYSVADAMIEARK